MSVFITSILFGLAGLIFSLSGTILYYLGRRHQKREMEDSDLYKLGIIKGIQKGEHVEARRWNALLRKGHIRIHRDEDPRAGIKRAIRHR